jgi:peptide methionine sulfoxide reductase MsrA
MQDLLRRYPGVLSTRVGYTGGDVLNATYRNHGTHAEAIEIVFDPQTISYRKLTGWFFALAFGQNKAAYGGVSVSAGHPPEGARKA